MIKTILFGAKIIKKNEYPIS
jgi:hypothetical protein